jgi:hypothetical protein
LHDDIDPDCEHLVSRGFKYVLGMAVRERGGKPGFGKDWARVLAFSASEARWQSYRKQKSLWRAIEEPVLRMTALRGVDRECMLRVKAGRPKGAPQVPRLPRIPCRQLRLPSAACGSLSGEPHKWSRCARRGRKSGYARDDSKESVAVDKEWLHMLRACDFSAFSCLQVSNSCISSPH